MNAGVTPADLVAECLSGAVRRLVGGVHSLTSARAVVVCADEQWVRVRFSASPGALPEPWEVDDSGWARAPRGSEPGLRDASADPVLVVVGVAESQVVAINALAVDEIGVTCSGRAGLVTNWLLQAQVQGAFGDTGSLAGALLSDNPDATVVVADPMTGARGWVDVLAAGTAWPVRPLKTPITGESADAPASPVIPASVVSPEPATDPTGGDPADGDPAAAGEPDAAIEAAPPTRGPSGGRMQVFGGFEVLDEQGAPLQPMQRDLVGGIYFNQPIGIHDLCERLFGTTERPASFHVAMSKMRRRGLNPVHIDGFYTIDIASDWRKFADLAGSDPASADTPALAAAAAMVSGPLFGSTPPRWASSLLEPMRSTVTAVCRELAMRHSDQPAVALGYARQGLSVDTDNPALMEIIGSLTEQLGE